MREPAGAPVGLGPELTRFRSEHVERQRALHRPRDGRRRAAALRLAAPLIDDEAGPYRQHRLQVAYPEVTEPLDPRSVYFQSFLGQAPTDHPGAIQEALQAVRPDGVRMLWGVADGSVPVPYGAEPVLLRSRDWYDAMARAAWIVTNVELEPWFRRREGQQVLETYHGYPVEGDGPLPVAGARPDPDARRPDAAPYLRRVEQPAHPDPGDGPRTTATTTPSTAGSSAGATRARTPWSTRAHEARRAS